MKKEIIKEEEITKILMHARRIKHRILIEFIYECGLSVDEVLSLRYSDIDLINGEVIVNGMRIALPLRLINLLRSYFSYEKSNCYIIETHHGKMSREAAESIIKAISLQAINKPASSADLIKNSFSQPSLLLNQEDCPPILYSRMDNLQLIQ